MITLRQPQLYLEVNPAQPPLSVPRATLELSYHPGTSLSQVLGAVGGQPLQLVFRGGNASPGLNLDAHATLSGVPSVIGNLLKPSRCACDRQRRCICGWLLLQFRSCPLRLTVITSAAFTCQRDRRQSIIRFRPSCEWWHCTLHIQRVKPSSLLAGYRHSRASGALSGTPSSSGTSSQSP